MEPNQLYYFRTIIFFAVKRFLRQRCYGSGLIYYITEVGELK